MKIKQLFSLIWNEFIYGGHLISFGAVSIVYTAAALLETQITWDFMVIVYLGIYAPYLYNRYKELNEDFLTNPERTKHIEKYAKHIPTIIIFFIIIILGIFFYFNKITALFLALFLILLSFSYSFFFKKLSKRIVAFKSFFVTLCWSLLIILLGVYYSVSFDLSLFLIFLFVFLREFINTVFSDTKDIESDKKDGLLTLAIFLGKEKLIKFLSVLNVLTITPIILGIYLGLFPVFAIILILVVPYTFYYLKKISDKKTNKAYLYNVIVESEYPLWLILIILGKILL